MCYRIHPKFTLSNLYQYARAKFKPYKYLASVLDDVYMLVFLVHTEDSRHVTQIAYKPVNSEDIHRKFVESSPLCLLNPAFGKSFL